MCEQVWVMLKTRQQVQNGVTDVKPHITKPILNLMTAWPLPEIVNQELPDQHLLGNLPDRPLSVPKGK